MYILVKACKTAGDISIRFDCHRERRRQNLTHNKTFEGKYQFRIRLRDVFGFAVWQENSTYDSSCFLTSKRNNCNVLMNRAASSGVANAKIVISGMIWCVPLSTCNVEQ